MRKVEFEWCEYLGIVNITHGKVYDVINYVAETNGDIKINILDDKRYRRTFIQYNKSSNEQSVFIFNEVTAEIRCKIIDGILE